MLRDRVLLLELKRLLQLGLFNATRRLQGVQLGLVNFSRHGGLPFMVLANVGW